MLFCTRPAGKGSRHIVASRSRSPSQPLSLDDALESISVIIAGSLRVALPMCAVMSRTQRAVERQRFHKSSARPHGWRVVELLCRASKVDFHLRR